MARTRSRRGGPGGRGRRGLGAGLGPRRGRRRALGAWGPPEPALTARFPGDWGGSFRLQLSYYALHAARLSTCGGRAAHMSPSPLRPSSARPRPPHGRLPKSGGSERASERASGAEGGDAPRRRRARAHQPSGRCPGLTTWRRALGQRAGLGSWRWARGVLRCKGPCGSECRAGTGTPLVWCWKVRREVWSCSRGRGRDTRAVEFGVSACRVACCVCRVNLWVC